MAKAFLGRCPGSLRREDSEIPERTGIDSSYSGRRCQGCPKAGRQTLFCRSRGTHDEGLALRRRGITALMTADCGSRAAAISRYSPFAAHRELGKDLCRSSVHTAGPGCKAREQGIRLLTISPAATAMGRSRISVSGSSPGRIGFWRRLCFNGLPSEGGSAPTS